MIVSSKIVSVHPQKDGRSFVAEQHVDDYGQPRDTLRQHAR